MALGGVHRWTYRGQILPTAREVNVEAVITAVDDNARVITADGLLGRDGLVIYQMEGFSIEVIGDGSELASGRASP